MGDFLERLFTSDFMPHGACWSWDPWAVWSNVFSDGAIALCYGVIGLVLLNVARNRKDAVSNKVLVLFGAFILFCGLGHAMEVYNTWHGLFRLAGLVKSITALLSVLAAIVFLRFLPKLLSVPAINKILTLDAALSSEQQEKRQVEGQLRESQDRFRILVEGTWDYSLILLDPEGRITSWNPGAERLTGYAEQEILGRSFACFFPEEARAAGKPEALLRLAASQGRIEDEGLRVRLDGSRFLANVIITAFHDGAGQLRGFTSVARDITEQRATQAALQALAETLEDKVRNQVQELRESEARLQGFIRHAPAAIAFKDSEGRYLLINPRMETLMGRPSRDILGRRNEDLFPPDEATRFRERERDRRLLLLPGPHVSLEVADDGAGMTPEVVKRIFDPFFTTKLTGRGLGLAAIHGIIRGHRGAIRVDSKPGQGSSFKLVFPAASEAQPPPAAGTPPLRAGPSRNHRQTVLVVDDEDEMRSVVVTALDRMGLVTLQARDGAEALAVFQAHRAQIRLILMDLTMPRMDGEEACRELRRQGASVPIVLSSGFNETEARRKFAGIGLAGFLQKPFALGTLADLVRRVLP